MNLYQEKSVQSSFLRFNLEVPKLERRDPCIHSGYLSSAESASSTPCVSQLGDLEEAGDKGWVWVSAATVSIFISVLCSAGSNS